MPNESQPTPGPWKLETVRTSSGICHKIGPFPWRPHQQNYACVYVDYPGNGPVEAELLANARLIAAAPSLLKALENLVDCISETRGKNADAALEAARAALAAAKLPQQ